MSVDELRRSFLFAESVEQRIRQFRKERIDLFLADQGPLEISRENPTLVCHIVPRVAFVDPVTLNIDKVMAPGPLGASGWNNMFSMDGLVNYSGTEGNFESIRAFTTLFRNGIQEAVAKVHAGFIEGVFGCSVDEIEGYIAQAVRKVLRFNEEHNIAPPYYVMASILFTEGVYGHFGNHRSPYHAPCRRAHLLLPDLVIDPALLDAGILQLRPLFDQLWNAFGHPSSPSFEHGGWYAQ